MLLCTWIQQQVFILSNPIVEWAMFQTEFEFLLPKGLLDEDGVTLHRRGQMRLATAKDELIVQNHPRVKREPTYNTLVMLSQVITTLGSLEHLTPESLEQLFSQDLGYLREFFNQINQTGEALIPTRCPQCDYNFQVELALSGES